MLKGKIQMGNGPDTFNRWNDDILAECSPEDRVFGWSIRASEVLHHDQNKLDDRVLSKMLYMGLLDKQEGAPAWTEPTSIKHGIRLMSATVVRVLQKVFRLEDKVRHS